MRALRGIRYGIEIVVAIVCLIVINWGRQGFPYGRSE